MSNSNIKQSEAGFTLIELLVVIAIIGTLASVVLASLNSAREAARDSRRLAEMRQIETALNMYYHDNGYYPRQGASGEDTGSGMICTSCTGGINAILERYMGNIPEDPSHDGATYYYYYDGRHGCGGHPNQAIVAALEMEKPANSNRNDTMCSSFGGEGGIGNSNSYMVILGESD